LVKKERSFGLDVSTKRDSTSYSESGGVCGISLAQAPANDDEHPCMVVARTFVEQPPVTLTL
jgi:hypothetical protein